MGGFARASQHAGIDAPEKLVRRNADLPAVPGGIRDGEGRVIAPDPATLPSDELDFPTLWKHPALLFAQTCWGPMEEGLAQHVSVVGQPSYDGIEGGQGELYSSAILMRRGDNGGRCPGARRRPRRSPARPLPQQAFRLQQPRFHVGHHRAYPRSRGSRAKASQSSPSASRRQPTAPRSSPSPRAGRMSAPSTAEAGIWHGSTNLARRTSWSSAGPRGARACPIITSRHTPPDNVARLRQRLPGA